VVEAVVTVAEADKTVEAVEAVAVAVVKAMKNLNGSPKPTWAVW
jgi:hypothetical protein